MSPERQRREIQVIVDRASWRAARVLAPCHVDPRGAASIVMSDPEGNEFCLA